MTTDNVGNNILTMHVLGVLLKMSAVENGKKPEIRISKTELLNVIILQYLPLNICFWWRCIYLDFVTNSFLFIKDIKIQDSCQYCRMISATGIVVVALTTILKQLVLPLTYQNKQLQILLWVILTVKCCGYKAHVTVHIIPCHKSPHKSRKLFVSAYRW